MHQSEPSQQTIARKRDLNLIFRGLTLQQQTILLFDGVQVLSTGSGCIVNPSFRYQGSRHTAPDLSNIIGDRVRQPLLPCRYCRNYSLDSLHHC